MEDVSRSDKRLMVSLDDPRHGWIGLEITYDDDRFSDSLSYTPNDFVRELASALKSALAAAQGMAIAHSEPVTYELVFLPLPEDMLELTIASYSDWSRKKYSREVVFSVTLQTKRVIRPFWRALRSVEARISKDRYRQEMNHDFPASLVREIGDLVRKLP
jgi:hypothetical protein